MQFLHDYFRLIDFSAFFIDFSCIFLPDRYNVEQNFVFLKVIAMYSQHQAMRKFVITALLVGLTLLLGFTPIGIISLPPANITIMVLPVVIGTLSQGLGVGLLLGLVFGVSSAVKALFLAPSALMAPLMASSPLWVLAISILPRLCVPIAAFLAMKAVLHGRKQKTALSVGVAAAAATLTNTVLYLGSMYLVYVLLGLDSAAVVSLILGAGALNGSLEIVAAVIVCTPVVLALQKAFIQED